MTYFEWKYFYDAAKKIKSIDKSEEINRTVIGRVYYAVLNCVYECIFGYNTDFHRHDIVLKALDKESQKNPLLGDYFKKFERLKAWRGDVDYIAKNQNTNKKVENALEYGANLLDEKFLSQIRKTQPY